MRLYLPNTNYIDTNEPLDISLELSDSEENVIAWYANPPVFSPVRANGFLGSIAEGGSVNFRDVFFNPHAHGTHTECLGHITPEVYSVNDSLKTFFFTAELITISPKKIKNESGEEDQVITAELIADQIKDKTCEALVIRTLPNTTDRLTKNYSDTNPAYFSLDCIPLLDKIGVTHLLIDLPSVDREVDGGELAFHHAFWGVPDNPKFNKTITELIWVENEIRDGSYILNLQMASFKNDASPSKPVLYAIHKTF